MRIREIVFNNFRSFRGERRISFVDPDTNMVRPVTVLAGSNGSSKTTVLEAIEALLEYFHPPFKSNDLVDEVLESGFIHLALEVTAKDLGDTDNSTQILHIAVGRRDLAPDDLEHLWPSRDVLLKDPNSPQIFDYKDRLATLLSVHLMILKRLKSRLTVAGYTFRTIAA